MAQSALAAVHVAPEQLVAVLSTNHAVRERPDGAQVAVVNARRPITDEATVLPVLGRTVDSAGRGWLRVRLPGRTLGAPSPPRTGWIAALGTQLRTTPWHIVVDLAARELTLYEHGRAVRRFPAIVGKPATPTPVGQYFVEEDVELSSSEPGGPVALATSDRSDVLKEFDGGPGQIAIHGLENLGGQLGSAESHGCVRLGDGSVTWLAAHAGAGTPVTID
jgi:lipoprotein-anchoring transpeptidase ErfK/SrfK